MTHTLTTAELASHTHTVSAAASTSGSVRVEEAGGAQISTPSTGGSGSGNAHSILNKYHALAMIMKT